MNGPLDLPLKDIHLPAEPGWWPPAPGWWSLLLLLVLTVAVFYWWRKRQLRIRRSAVNMASKELDRLQGEFAEHRDVQRFVADISILLRRLSISAFPRSETASLTGDAWLQFLDSPLGEHNFSRGPGRVLIEAPYRPNVEVDELEPLVALCRQWLNKLAESAGEVAR